MGFLSKILTRKINLATKQWRRVFSDESKFNLKKNEAYADDKYSSGTKLHKNFVIATMKYGSCSIML